MESELITIGITCYNSEHTIERAIESAINQSYENLEIIIVDDGSTDDSVNRISPYLSEKIRLIKNEENMGYPYSLNKIIENSNGEFVAFFDDDDAYVTYRISSQLQRIKDYEHQACTKKILCYSNRAVVRKGETKTTGEVLAIGRNSPEPFGNIVADFLLADVHKPPYTWGQFGSGTLMARRAVFEDIGAFDTFFKRCAEWDLAIRASFAGYHFISVNESLCTQYITDGHGNEKSTKRVLFFNMALRRKHKDYLKIKKIYLASLVQARVRMHSYLSNKYRSRLYLAISFLLAPKLISSYIKRKYHYGN